MEGKTEKKTIKNEVEKKMRKKCVPRALRCMAWRNVGPGGEDFRRGTRTARPRKTGTERPRQANRQQKQTAISVQHATPSKPGRRIAARIPPGRAV